MQELKTWPEHFQDIWDGIKTYEVRLVDNREFRVWSVVHLREYEPIKRKYTGREVVANIVHMAAPIVNNHGETLVVFGIRVYQKIDRNSPEFKAPKV